MSERVLSLIAALLAAVVLGLALFWHPEPPLRDIPRANGQTGPGFSLQSADGPVSLGDFRGKVVLVYFGYTYCPDICPTSLAATAEALNSLKPEELEKVAMVFISVDAERDTPVHLKEYAAFFHPKVVGVTGSAEALAAAARSFGVFYARQKASTVGGYVVDHSSDTYVVGRDGQLAGKIPHAAPADQVVAVLRRHLN